jgi:hypothetical protein
MWHIDPLLCKDFVTNNETTAVAMQLGCKYASTTIDLLLEMVFCNPLLGSCGSWTTATEMGVFSMWSVTRSYLQDNWGTQLSFDRESVESQPVKRRLRRLM